MKHSIISERVQGASHKRVDKICQDNYFRKEIGEDITILAVADGHGSDASPFSETGSKIAVDIFGNIMENYVQAYRNQEDQLLTFLNRESEVKLARSIDETWKAKVLANHLKNKRPTPKTPSGKKDEKTIYRMYGTTLLGILITKTFVFAFQMGDGDMVLVNVVKADFLLEGDHLLGVETHSLSRENAWEKAISVVKRREADEVIPFAIMMSTDGFSNSYKSEDAYLHACREYFSMIKEHGLEAVDKNLKQWLEETSQHGSGDDITMVIAYFYKEVS